MKLLSVKETSMFCEQLGMILDSGISQSDGIRAIALEVENKEYRDVLLRIAEELDLNILLSDALQSSGIFDEYIINMIKVGEKSGYMVQVMSQLAVYYQRMDETKNKIKDAIVYPSILILMMLIVIIILIVQVLPIFQDVLNDLGTGLSSFALTLMNFGQILSQYGLYILIALILVIAGGFARVFFNKNNHSLLSNLGKLPFTKKLGNDLAIAQFSFAISLLVNSGYAIEDSLDIIPNMINNNNVKEKIATVKSLVNEGISFDEALIRANIFKSLYNRMLTIGVKAGRVEETMSKISLEYENEVNSNINTFLNVVEPTLVAISSVIVGFILLSVMLPLMSIMSSLG